VGCGTRDQPPVNQRTDTGAGKWSAGPTVVALRQSGPFTVGGLWNQVWSFSGDANRDDVSQMFFQPFVAYTGRNLVTYTVQAEMTANWEAADDK
jgi:hypothetical protein